MNENVNIINWFEVPALDINRAKAFYQTVFNIEVGAIMDFMDTKMCFFPSVPGNGKISGAIVCGNGYQPGTTGIKIYFNGNPDLSDSLSRIIEAGGSITMPKTMISPDYGYMAFFTDSEGNSVALHSQN